MQQICQLASFCVIQAGPRLGTPSHKKMTSENNNLLLCHLTETRSRQRGHVILGNEAGDLDSIASAIGLSYATRPSLSTPIINIPRNDMELRRDGLLALKICDIPASALTFADDVGEDLGVRSGDKITLVDHNTLASHQKELSEYVSGIVDHHVDGGLFLTAEPRVVARVGSCATLVSEMMDGCMVTARLLMCAILLDTRNMAVEGRGTMRDERAMEKLRRIGRWDMRQCETVYKELKQARADVSGFGVVQLLRRDAKIVHIGKRRVAVCSVPVGVRGLVEKGGLMGGLEEFQKERSVGAVVILMGLSGVEKGGFRREILVEETDGALEDILARDGGHLDLKRFEVEGAKTFCCYQQGNGSASRKVVLPLLEVGLRRLEC